MLDPSESSLARESDPGSRSVIGLLRRGREMAQIALGPNHPRRHRHGVDLNGLQPNRPHSSLSFHSLKGQQQQRPHSSLNIAHLTNGHQHGLDLEDDGGAEIPDIPLKRPSRRGVTPDQPPLNVSRIDEAWGDEINGDFRPQRPINPNSITPQKDRLCVLLALSLQKFQKMTLITRIVLSSRQRAPQGGEER